MFSLSEYRVFCVRRSVFFFLYLHFMALNSRARAHDDIITIQKKEKNKNNNPFKMMFRTREIWKQFLVIDFRKNSFILCVCTEILTFSRALMNRIWNSENTERIVRLSKTVSSKNEWWNNLLLTVSISQITRILITLNSFKKVSYIYICWKHTMNL